jgi:hypothetical protein
VTKWKGTKVVRKAGSYPTSPTDGVLIMDNQTRNAYSTTGFVDSGLTNGTPYYYQLFPYSEKNAYNTNTINQLTCIPNPYAVFGVRIALGNSNPSNSVIYTDESRFLTPESSWDSQPIFRDIKPCVLKDGVVQYYLQPNNFALKEDGSVADITSGADGDVMIEFPKTGLSITTVDNSIQILITDEPSNPTFKYYAHSRETDGDREKLYYGAFLGFELNGKLRSLSGKAPTKSTTVTKFRELATANGAGYDMVSFYPLLLLQCLYILRFKDLNSQTAIGAGTTDYTSVINTGQYNDGGMYKKNSSKTWGAIKCHGVEDLWGNLEENVEGVFIDSSNYIYTAFQNFNNSGDGYTRHDVKGGVSGLMSKPAGTTETGFIARETNGSESTYFCDSTSSKPGTAIRFGGDYNSVKSAGIFAVKTSTVILGSNNVGARLMYL